MGFLDLYEFDLWKEVILQRIWELIPSSQEKKEILDRILLKESDVLVIGYLWLARKE